MAVVEDATAGAAVVDVLLAAVAEDRAVDAQVVDLVAGAPVAVVDVLAVEDPVAGLVRVVKVAVVAAQVAAEGIVARGLMAVAIPVAIPVATVSSLLP